jgi:hypothetical protein
MRQGAGKDFIAGVSKSLGDESNGAGSAGLARPPTQGGKRIKRIIYGALTALTVAAAGLNGAAATDNTIGPKVVDTITSASLKLIQSALPELTRYGLRMDTASLSWRGTASTSSSSRT